MKTTVELNRKHLEEIVRGLLHHIDRAKKKGAGIPPDDLRHEVSQLEYSLKFAVEQENRNAKEPKRG